MRPLMEYLQQSLGSLHEFLLYLSERLPLIDRLRALHHLVQHWLVMLQRIHTPFLVTIRLFHLRIQQFLHTLPLISRLFLAFRFFLLTRPFPQAFLQILGPLLLRPQVLRHVPLHPFDFELTLRLGHLLIPIQVGRGSERAQCHTPQNAQFLLLLVDQFAHIFLDHLERLLLRVALPHEVALLLYEHCCRMGDLDHASEGHVHAGRLREILHFRVLVVELRQQTHVVVVLVC